MEAPKSHHKPDPGIAEALHPEIGNGSAFESDKHAFVLRTPDHSLPLIAFIHPTHEDVDENVKQDIQEEEVINIGISAIEELTFSPPDNLPEETRIPEISKLAETTIDAADEQVPTAKTIKKKKTGKTGKIIEPEETGDAGLDPEPKVTKPQKAGKLLRKAAKSVKKLEEGRTTPSHENVDRPQITLSPFTSWLKKLTGSDYVHPYEDDFAFEQASGGAKEGISETFADLLAAQGYKDQAREMYLKLMEKYPEKSGFFAAKIEAL